jgi:putative tricarboxylic transport membrane protein
MCVPYSVRIFNAKEVACMAIDRKELVIGGGVFVFAILLILFLIPGAVVSPRSVSIEVLNPAFWPKIVSWGLLILGLFMLMNIFLKAKTGSCDYSSGKYSARSFFRLSVLVVFLAGYYLILPYIGMVWASSIAYILLSMVFCKTGYRMTAVAVGIILPAALYAFFYHVAGVDIPQSEFARLP